ncbi:MULTISPECIES: iron ABC transporter ATP-binding protein [Streptomyces]|uniref:ATP-binding cassette domain-containing protein n=1 Tax=Streptomyces viridosporus T7A TaxID=665577 RepID=A0ABX6AM53_STRVD|nr:MULTISPECIES: ATP-binding cassette domain-containing protein [Streptomyces]PWJ04561.1 iron ABC transporter ATP-binding protein [Streptomyces sp. NWU49]QEU88097.1 ATP-binding cassette domain-containing protein [Streptomyces viridosporus T7A]
MIEFRDLVKSYGDRTVLGPVSGRIEEGGITSLIGPNGAGKSTLLTLLGRLAAPTSGTVLLDGTDVHRTPSAEMARRLAILRQDNHFTARVTVRELVAFGRFPHSRGRLTAEDHEHIDRALDFLALGDLAGRYLDQLSGGQRQRAYVAMVLAQDTRYALLDEPLNNLDIKHAVRMMEQLRSAADELNKTVVLVVHDINIAAGYSDHIIALRDGAIVANGTPAELMDPDLLTRIFDTPVQVHEVDGRPLAVHHR